MTATNLQLARLLQLASPALPVGAYTYSQGLEWAVESGVIRDEATAGRWIGDLLAHGIGRYEAPLVSALMVAWSAGNSGEILRLNADLDELIARRETAKEIRQQAQCLGFTTLADDGLRRVLDGSTSIEELGRVIDLTDRM